MLPLLERIVDHLERVRRVAEKDVVDRGVAPDYDRFEAFFLELLDRAFDAKGLDERWRWKPVYLRAFVDELHWSLLDGVGARWPATERLALVEAGLARASRLAMSDAEEEGSYFLVECKNWSRPCDPRELNHFLAKLQRRFDRARLGFFVAASGFTEGVRTTLAAERKSGHLVIPIDRNDLQKLVEVSDRSEALKELHQRTIEGVRRALTGAREARPLARLLA